MLLWKHCMHRYQGALFLDDNCLLFTSWVGDGRLEKSHHLIREMGVNVTRYVLNIF